MSSFQYKPVNAPLLATPATPRQAGGVVAVPPGLHYAKGVVQRVVYDVTADQKVVPIDVEEAYKLIAPYLADHDPQVIKTRILPMVLDKDHDYDKWDILEWLRPFLSASASSSSSSSTPSLSAPSSTGAIRKIGKRDYRQVEGSGRAIYKYEEKLWHIKESDIQRSYAENEYIGAFLYAAITGQPGGEIELHYAANAGNRGSTDDRGQIVKRHLLGYRNWIDSSANPGTDYDVTGLGEIAVAAWFLGDNDIHGGNFGTLDTSAVPPLVVIDASGALNEDILLNEDIPEESLDIEDYRQLPLPPNDREGNWDLYHREPVTPEDTTVASLPAPVTDRLEDEKERALQRILHLNFDAIERELLGSIFRGGESLDTLKDVSKLKIFNAWKAAREALESRRDTLQEWVDNRRRGQQEQQGS